MCWEVLWLRHLWPHLQHQVVGPTIILGGDVACVALFSSHQVTLMAKQLDMIHYFATDRVQLGNINFKYVASAMKIMDVLPKPLFEQQRAFSEYNLYEDKA